jgi:hypothetical protein
MAVVDMENSKKNLEAVGGRPRPKRRREMDHAMDGQGIDD